MSQIITLKQLEALVDTLVTGNARVVAPVVTDRGLCFFQYVTKGSEAALARRVAPVNSIKEFFFPRHEAIYSYVRHENDVTVTDAPPFSGRQVILGARPCDAAALPILDPLFAWDYQDRFYQDRRERSTVVSFACQSSDRHCFCGTVGGSPENPSGSDAMLYDLGDGTWEVRCLTDKGRSLFDGKTSESDKTGGVCETPTAAFDPKKIAAWLDSHFNDPCWDEESRRCVGCGACTYVCPTCHCFDIVDEGSFRKGERVKNWDSCQMALFTLHASGHNPRATQGQRQRQRVTHKFAIYPEKFGMILCTGCGNCSRDCSVALGVKPMLEALAKKP